MQIQHALSARTTAQTIGLFEFMVIFLKPTHQWINHSNSLKYHFAC